MTNERKISRTFFQSFLLLSGISGAIVFTVTYSLDGFFHSSYNWLLQPISDLEGVSYGWIQQINFIVYAIFIIAFSIAMKKELKKGPAAIWFPALSIVSACGIIMSGVFTHDPLHTIGSFISFLALVAGFFVMAGRFVKLPQWKWWATYSIFSAILAMVLLALFGYARAHGGYAGLLERSVIFDRSVWSLLLVVMVLKGKSIAVDEK